MCIPGAVCVTAFETGKRSSPPSLPPVTPLGRSLDGNAGTRVGPEGPSQVRGGGKDVEEGPSDGNMEIGGGRKCALAGGACKVCR